jgi:ferric-dicitrate binding protein FerR (iron transport regulator)
VDTRRYEQLSAYLDGELPLDQRLEFEQWLRRSPEAKRHYRQLRLLADQIEGAQYCTGTPVDVDRLFGQVHKEAVWMWGSVGGTLATAAAMLLLVSFFTPSSESTFQISRYVLDDPAPVDPYLVLLRDDSVVQK